MTFDVDPVGLLTREVLRERTADLVAEACAWTVGLSDRPHHARRHGRIVPTGITLGTRALHGQMLGSEEDAHLELTEARAGSFQDALNALTADGRLYAELFEEEVLAEFVLDTCMRAVQRLGDDAPALLAELLDELGEDGADLRAVVRAAEWEAPLRTEAEHLVLAALGAAALLDVEASGLPLALVRAAEGLAQAAAPPPLQPTASADDDLAGARFLADVAIRDAALPCPVPPDLADRLLDVLLAEGLEREEVLRLLPELPVQQDTVEEVAQLLAPRSS